ncbi:zinc finger CCCH domain-containing protein 5 isoform X2 [Punica granatum]|uniref:Zinc finger CCCH domain-containing protein 5 isoform X2 n=1 Tax=Punica granatum TaxID=22663 RepID=A0A6P8DBX8_PUNGR|nr:zinc finger CCCH domain-containing protein 5 isoform X2 [Punica granatum]
MSELITGEYEEAGGGGGEGVEEDRTCDGEKQQLGAESMGSASSRKEKRKAAKKMKRKQLRMEAAVREREEEEAKMNDPDELRRMEEAEREEEERRERERREFEERERAWLEAMEKKRKEEEEGEEEERRRKALEESQRLQEVGNGNEQEEEDGDWEYIEEGPAEIIWQGNEIIVKKKRVKVPKKDATLQRLKEDADRPTSNPLPPQSEAFADCRNSSLPSAQQILENVAQQVPNFGTEQDKAHCPFHLKTGACRFGQRCSRVHFYPDVSCTLLIRNMYNGPGLAWEQDEGLEHTDEEVERSYEEFYEDVHTEFLKFGEIVNFKVCRNGSFHLRGNVYIHYKSLDSAVLAYQSINGRFFASKQVNCEYVNVTRWKVAICGEYMRSRYKTCSHGTACNFIHCFRNPGGDYEWADWDKPPPRNQSQRSRSRETGSGRYHRNRGGENGFEISRSSEEYDIYDKKQRKRTNGERKNEDKLSPRYSHRSNRRSGCDSDGDHLPSDKDVEKHHQERESSKWHKVSELKGDYGDTRRRAHKADPDWNRSDSDVDRERRDRSHGSSKSRKKVKREGSRERTRDSESPVDDCDRDNYHRRRRRSSRSSWSDSNSYGDQTIDLHDRWDPGDE